MASAFIVNQIKETEMNVILLSGGSGKSLWPLSNGTRSKQFLRLLTAPDGTKESMMQRMVRQLREAVPDVKLTAVTSLEQRDIIVNQLGDNVDVVTEPVRRDTFPAIALAAAYMQSEKSCSSDDVVVVMPCDAYTDKSYFESFGKMVDAVRSGVADLVLMGVRPQTASSTLGYIIPAVGEGNDGILPVEGFVEKPESDYARQLMEQGAYWNTGVFVFRLGYLMKFAEEYLPVSDFRDFQKNYWKFPVTSFDCEVTERTLSRAMIVYEGSWKDLGTWQVLSEELDEVRNGNVTFDDTTSGTHAINELDIPLLCSGTKDLMVVASPDGILVADKSASDKVKDYVDVLALRPMYEERRWGTYRVIDRVEFDDGHNILTKQLNIKTGAHISYQLHRHRDEIWTFVDGEGRLVLDGVLRKVGRGDVVCIKKGQLHTVMADKDLCIIEVQSGDQLTEEDIERFDWEW